MKTTPQQFVAFLAAMLFFCFGASAAPTISFTTAKAKAAREGKVLLVDFTATWCMPCKWMDETTFSDPQVLSYLRENYVSIKIDIDDFDGFALKQAYNVQSLPTMIFFSSDGKQLDRIEEGVGAVALLDKLAQHNIPQNRRKLGGEAPTEDWSQPFAKMSNEYDQDESYTAPAEYVASHEVTSTSSTTYATTSSSVTEEEILGTTFVTNAKPFVQAEPTQRSVPAIESRKIESVLNKNSTPLALEIQVLEVEDVPDLSSPVLAEAEGITTHVSAEDAPSMEAANVRIFSLQAGAFSSQSNAVRAADHLRDYTEKPVLIEFDMLNDKPVYRIYVGRFTAIQDAEALGKQLYMYGFSCIPKELAMR